MVALNHPIRDWAGQRVWIIGASRGIGASLARNLARRGAKIALSARREAALHEVATDFASERTVVLPFDLTLAPAVIDAERRLHSLWGGYDLVVVMAGDYVPLDAWHFDRVGAAALIAINLQGPLHAIEAVVPRLRDQGRGGIALVASAAGYRGLPKSLVYGPTKAAVINLAESLYFDLQPRGLAAYVINPGFVRTELTAQNDFAMPALISAEDAAEAIVAGFARGDFEIHFPRRFTRVLKLLRLLPYRWYFRLVMRKTQA